MKSEVQCVWQQWSPAEKMSTEAGQRGTTRTAPSYPSPSITARAAASLLLLLHPCLPGGRSCRPGLFITVRRQDRFFTPTTTPGQGPAPPRRSSVLRATKQSTASVAQFHSLIEASLLVLAPRGCFCAVRKAGICFATAMPALASDRFLASCSSLALLFSPPTLLLPPPHSHIRPSHLKPCLSDCPVYLSSLIP